MMNPIARVLRRHPGNAARSRVRLLILIAPALLALLAGEAMYELASRQLFLDLSAAGAAVPDGLDGRLWADRAVRLSIGLLVAMLAAVGLLRLLRAPPPLRRARPEAPRRAPESADSRQQLRTLEQAYAELRKQQQAREDHWAHAHHELRTPLIAVTELAGSLLKSPLDADQQQQLQQIRQSARSLLDLVNDTLDWERLELGKLSLRKQPFAPAQIVEDTVATMSTLAYAKSLELVVIIDHDVAPEVVGDEQRWQQIVTNLVSNAIKFTERGEVELRLSAAPADGRPGLRLTVRDTGPGIAPERLDTLFRPYERIEDTTRSRADGTGLGLSIVQRLVALMDGRIEVDSTPGTGTRFAVTLPFAAAGETRPAQWHGLRGAAVVALDPHPTALRALEHQLAFWGVEVTAAGGIDALVQMLADAQSHHDALLISPSHTREPDSRIRELLDLANAQHRPVVARLNSVDTRIHELWRRAGATAVLPKCASRLELFRTLLELVAPDQAAPQRSLDGQRILLIENNPANARVMETLLQRLGATPSTAPTLARARALLNETMPDAVLLDNRLDDGSGVEFTAELLERNPGLTVVGMSAWLSPEQELQWRDAGVTSVLLKPFDPERLARALGARADADISIPAGLAHDAEIIPVITDELPQQFSEVDRAFVAGDLERLRAAAHQLHGSAAFFHLEPLNQQLAELETVLNNAQSLAMAPELRDDIDRIRRTVSATVSGLAATSD